MIACELQLMMNVQSEMKVMDKLICSSLFTQIEKHNKFDSSKIVFKLIYYCQNDMDSVKKHSTELAASNLIDHLTYKLDSGNIYNIDLSKAFHTLTQRQQVVEYNGCISEKLLCC